jgi:hypothetical protein
LQEEGQSDDYYIVHPDVTGHIADEISYCCFYACMTRQGWPFLWPIMWPSPDGKPNKWLTSRHEAAQNCIHKWARVIGVQELQSYVLKTPRGKFPDPVWPKETMDELLELALGADHLIGEDWLNHPVVRRLRGLV